VTARTDAGTRAELGWLSAAGGANGKRRQASWRWLLRCASPLRVTTLAVRAEFAIAPTRTGCARLIGAHITHHANFAGDRHRRQKTLDKKSPIQGWAKRAERAFAHPYN